MNHPTAHPGSLTSMDVQTWVRATLARMLEVAPETIQVHEPFVNTGIRPRCLITELEQWLGRSLAPTLLYDYPTIAMLAAHLCSDEQPLVPHEHQVESAPTSTGPMEPIAIIGLGCRFPGGANSPTTFWQMLCDGVDTITEMPTDRWDVSERYQADRTLPGAVVTRWGGFLDDIDQFDSGFFGISPREAACMDPQQRILLETAWEALEDAGMPADQLAGSQTGVFIGSWLSDYGQAQLSMLDQIDTYVGTGSVLGLLANRLSYAFDFHGPSMVTDTACSSSLVALHMACQSLRTGEATLALAGGSNLLLSPAFAINFSKARVLSPDGRCKTFDARANGYVRSEGAGLVVLKRLSQAVADGDRVYAVIRGGVVQQDGLTNGIMAPNRHAQEAMLRTAYRRAGVAPEEVGYVEAHGTGTFLGDPIEATALGGVLGASRAADAPCLVGSVKTNIGHLEGAAGVAGLIKVALMLHHRELVPSLHFAEPNPHIPFEDLRLQVVQSHCPWPDGGRPRIAGVSSFGFGGTIAHMILEEAPDVPTRTAPVDTRQSYVLPLSARNPQALHDLASAYAAFLTTSPAPLPDICYTASVRRDHHAHRLAVVGRSHTDLAQALQTHTTTATLPPTPTNSPPRLVFVFPGQGGQWAGMGQQLLQTEPVFRAAIAQCEAAFEPYVDWSLQEVLTADGDQDALSQIDVIQPTLFAIQVALAALWRSWGVTPAAVMGHSMGEVAAAYVAGALTLDDAARIICRRSQLMHRTSGQGAMAVVGVPAEQARTYINGTAAHVAVAVCNSPTSTVLSGDPDYLDPLLHKLETQNIFWRKVKVDVASHSPQMEPLKHELVAELAALQPRTTAIPLYSTVTGHVIDGESLHATYWGDNLRQPVQFAQAVQQTCADGHTLFLEISPHPVLGLALADNLEHVGVTGQTFASLKRNEDERHTLLETFGALYTHGLPIDWSAHYPDGACVTLPTYPWQRQRYWLEGATTRHGLPVATRHAAAALPGAHPLLPPPLTLSDRPGHSFWTFPLAHGLPLHVEDHVVADVPTLPAAAYADLALAAAQNIWSEQGVVIEHLALNQALHVPADQQTTVQLALAQTADGVCTFTFNSRSGEQQPDTPAAWVEHASGTLRQVATPLHPRRIDLATLQARCLEEGSSAAHYDQMAARGLAYGPHYQSLQHLWRGDGEALARLLLSKGVPRERGFVLHPELLDGGLQLLLAALPPTNETYLPVAIDTLRMYAPLTGEVWAWVQLLPTADAASGRLVGTLVFADPDGLVLAEIETVQFQRLGQAATSTSADAISGWCYEPCWQEQPLAPAPAAPQPGGWLIFADRGGAGVALAEHLTSNRTPCRLLFADDLLDKPLLEQEQHLAALLQEQPAWQGIVHLWSLDTAGDDELSLDTLYAAQNYGCGSLLTLVRVLDRQAWRTAPRLWLVTSGSQAVTADEATIAVEQAPLWGMGQVILYEHGDLHCTRVDLSTDLTIDDVAALAAECQANSPEDQVAVRAGQRYVARLTHAAPAVHTDAAVPAGEPLLTRPVTPAGVQPFSLIVERPGILESMTLRPLARQMPAPDEVEIEVIAAGLNFRDVLLALGVLTNGTSTATDPILQPGFECAGRVVAVGSEVRNLTIGQHVIAFAPHSFGSFVTTSHMLVAPMPDHLTFEEAATIPLAFATAFYALQQVGRLAQGERVLIHAASGGVGLAAVQIAQLVGAEIFATAGSPEKRAFLRDLGVQHVFNSRSLDFADEILQVTNGEGVDVVLNSLGGVYIDRSFDLLRDYGRFVEIGQRDYLENRSLGLQPFLRNLSFSLVDLRNLWQQRPDQIQKLLNTLMALFEQRQCHPLPYQTFALEETYAAFCAMARAQHIGKLIVRIGSTTTSYIPATDAYRAAAETTLATPHPLVRADGTYLITGGTGGLGLVVARWLAEHGASHLALISRRGASDAALQAIAELRAHGAEVTVYQADVAMPNDVDRVLQSIAETLPPLRGVVHAAGLLDDALLTQMTHAQLERVLAPKLAGAWNLHTGTQTSPLDFFVLFSSIVSMLGSPGQGNYAAANAFLDSLAHHRRALGLPALSINWGPWADVGLAAAQANRGARLAGRGMESLSPEEGIAAFARVLDQTAPQVGLVRLHARQWRQFYPGFAASPLLEHLTHKDQPAPHAAGMPAGIGATLAAAAPADRWGILTTYLREQVGQVLRLPAEQVETQRPFTVMGIDSLMTLELRNRLEVGLSLTLPATLIWSYPTINALAEHLTDKLGLALHEVRQVGEISAQPWRNAPTPNELAVPSVKELEELDEELDDLSDEELAELEGLLCNELGG